MSISTAVTELVDTVFPQCCLVCYRRSYGHKLKGQPFLWCPECQQCFRSELHCWRGNPHTFFITTYSEQTRIIINAIKENTVGARGIYVLKSQLFSLVIPVLVQFLQAYCDRNIIIIPAPSVKKKTNNIAYSLAAALEQQEPRTMRSWEVFTLARGVQDSAGLSAARRQQNMRHNLVTRYTPSTIAATLLDYDVVLLDDIITTGATLEALEESLAQLGVRVRARITLCAN